jgi:hypothetical protein
MSGIPRNLAPAAFGEARFFAPFEDFVFACLAMKNFSRELRSTTWPLKH